MKRGLVLEGGAMRGMFTAGILDVLMDEGVVVDGAIGVSAGAVFGCNYKSKQRGRAIRYNKRFAGDKRYCSFSSLIKTGDLYNAKFDYDELPNKLDPFDYDTFTSNPMEFIAVATDADTGEAVYHKCTTGRGEDMQWLRASASMPALSNLVEIDGRRLSDGGTADSVPLKYFESLGYDRIIVILTQPKGFVKEKNKMLPLLRFLLRKTPKLIEALESRHLRYNETTAYIEEKEAKGEILVLRPKAALNIKAGEKDPEELERVYQMGVEEGKERLGEIKAFLSYSHI